LTKTAKSEIYAELNIPGSESDHARYLSVIKPHTGDFLLAIPKSKDMTLNALEFALALRIRLGCDMPNMPRKCNCARNPVLDKKGTHLTCCAKGGYLSKTHNAIERDVVVMAVSAGVPASTLNKDLLLLNNAPNSHNNKGDILMPTLGDQDKGWPMLADLTGTHPACDSSCTATRRDPKSSIIRAEKRKNNIYLDLAATHDITFTPLAFECYGAFSEKFEKLIRKLCRMRAEILDIEETSVLNYWFRRISCTLQRSNKQQSHIRKNS
jgi:hypothetical protein